LKSAQHAPPYLDKLDMASALHLPDQKLLTLDSLLHIKHAQSRHFQWFINRDEPPTITEWHRWQPLTLTGGHCFTGCRAEDVQQFESPRCWRVVGRIMLGSSRHDSLLLVDGVRMLHRRRSGIDLDQCWPILGWLFCMVLVSATPG
jgi:hypothetical protein